MKKLAICAVSGLVLLCGCGAVQTNTKTAQTLSETADTISYNSNENFLDSGFYADLQNNAITPYHLEFDENRYETVNIMSDKSFYEFIVRDKEKERDFVIQITNDYYIKNADDLLNQSDEDKCELENIGNSAGDYDVVLFSSDYDGDYYLSYFLDTGRLVTIGFNGVTRDDAIEYFKDIALCPDI